MGDLYERLLARVTDTPAPRMSSEDAVQAVLELHKPQPCPRPCSLRHEHITCGVCEPPDFHVELRWWPCDTVRAIARALDVEVSE